MTLMKWFFHIWIALSAKLRRLLYSGTSWNVMWVAQISFIYAVEISLSMTWYFGKIPLCFILDSALRRAKIIYPSVFLFMGSIQVDFP